MSDESNLPKKMGRPSGFNELLREKVLELISRGRTDEEIGEIIGVHRTTINKWRKLHPDFNIAVKEAKFNVDQQIEQSLFHSATGYSHPDEHIHVSKDGFVTRTPTVKHYPPNATSMIFWLKNRRPKEWKEKTEVEHTGNAPSVTIVLPSNTREVKATLLPAGDTKALPLDTQMDTHSDKSIAVDVSQLVPHERNADVAKEILPVIHTPAIPDKD